MLKPLLHAKELADGEVRRQGKLARPSHQDCCLRWEGGVSTWFQPRPPTRIHEKSALEAADRTFRNAIIRAGERDCSKRD
jgi:hypothetical protein